MWAWVAGWQLLQEELGAGLIANQVRGTLAAVPWRRWLDAGHLRHVKPLRCQAATHAACTCAAACC